MNKMQKASGGLAVCGGNLRAQANALSCVHCNTARLAVKSLAELQRLHTLAVRLGNEPLARQFEQLIAKKSALTAMPASESVNAECAPHAESVEQMECN